MISMKISITFKHLEWHSTKMNKQTNEILCTVFVFVLWHRANIPTMFALAFRVVISAAVISVFWSAIFHPV